ncbi:MAG: arylsulfatase [Phycisphaerales bacterium]|nr:arylsulfatase [Phycisphaerales bacterium]
MGCNFSRTFAALAVGLTILGAATSARAEQPLSPTTAAAAPRRPNVIVILADDMGFSDVGCYGGEIRTPNVDRLAAEGVRFAQFYNMARCCPTRAALLTGLYPHQAGMGAMNQDLGKPAYRGELSDRCVTIAEALRGAGYQTGMVGKWHLTHLTISPGGPAAKRLVNFEAAGDLSPSKANWPVNRGFDDHWGTIPGVDSYYDPYGLVHNEQTIKPSDFKPDGKGYYYTDFITDRAVEMIDRFTAARGKAAGDKATAGHQGDGKADDAKAGDDKPGADKPFFQYVAYTAPHWPMQAREADVARYADAYTAGWDAVREARLRRQVAMGLFDNAQVLSLRPTAARFNEGASAVGAWADAAEKPWQVRRMAVYAAMVESMDRGIGRILDALKARGADRDTAVIFLSDNGACAENVQPGWYDVPGKTRDGRRVRVGNDPTIAPGPEEAYQSYGPAWANASNTPFRRFKHFTEEGGISTPFVVRWPAGITGDAANGRIEKAQVGHVIDLMPTVLELAGATYPKQRGGQDVLPPEGKSLVPVLKGGTIDRGPLFWEHEGNRAVRVGQWKLVAAHNEKWQLYDVVADRTETRDLAAEKPEKVAELRELYEAWAKRCGVEAWPVKR